MNNFEVLVIGGGASGNLSALVAHDAGANVAIIEGSSRVLRKLLTTGNGRCNFSNNTIKPPYLNYHSTDTGFYTSVLNQLSVKNTLDLFFSYGLTFKELEKGKLYPESLQASGVVDLFRLNVQERNIPVFLDSPVTDIKIDKTGFTIETGNETNKTFLCKKVLIATGGKAAPNTGSDGSLFEILKKLGHHIIKPIPAIVQLKVDYPHLKTVSGVRFDALASVLVNNQMKRSEYEEVIFTDYGISGTAILDISRDAAVSLEQGYGTEIVLDLFTDKTKKELHEFFEGLFAMFPYRSIYDALMGIVNKKLLTALLKDAGIDIHKTCDSLTYKEKQNFYNILKAWRFKCTGTTGFSNAQVTAGGVDTKEINPDTLESKLINGMYFAGEVMDVDGDCGGFNLQWAWSSGYVSGTNISKN